MSRAEQGVGGSRRGRGTRLCEEKRTRARAARSAGRSRARRRCEEHGGHRRPRGPSGQPRANGDEAVAMGRAAIGEPEHETRRAPPLGPTAPHARGVRAHTDEVRGLVRNAGNAARRADVGAESARCTAWASPRASTSRPTRSSRTRRTRRRTRRPIGSRPSSSTKQRRGAHGQPVPPEKPPSRPSAARPGTGLRGRRAHAHLFSERVIHATKQLRTEQPRHVHAIPLPHACERRRPRGHARPRRSRVRARDAHADRIHCEEENELLQQANGLAPRRIPPERHARAVQGVVRQVPPAPGMRAPQVEQIVGPRGRTRAARGERVQGPPAPTRAPRPAQEAPGDAAAPPAAPARAARTSAPGRTTARADAPEQRAARPAPAAPRAVPAAACAAAGGGRHVRERGRRRGEGAHKPSSTAPPPTDTAGESAAAARKAAAQAAPAPRRSPARRRPRVPRRRPSRCRRVGATPGAVASKGRKQQRTAARPASGTTGSTSQSRTRPTAGGGSVRTDAAEASTSARAKSIPRSGPS